MSEAEFTLADCTRTILTEIAEGLSQKDVGTTYGLAIVSESSGTDTPDWPAINRAILDRWSRSGLERIKRLGWKVANGQGVRA